MAALYRPSNGVEGMCFQAQFCDKCIHESEASPCDILSRSLLFGVEHEDYPREWQYDEDDNPTCTAFATEIPPPSLRELEEKGQQRLLQDV